MDCWRQHILVIRLSALGDVALLQPVLLHRAAANPDVLFTVAAPPLLAPLFEGVQNIQFLPTRKQQSAKELYKHLSSVKPTSVADMHHVNRVIAACFYFRLHGIAVYSLKKHMYRRSRMVSRWFKVRSQMLPVWKRYDEVFERMGLNGNAEQPEMLGVRYPMPERTVGIAPFAQHQGKIWSLELMEQVVKQLSADNGSRVVLFGSKAESSLLEEWANRYPYVESMAGKGDFVAELRQIGSLDVMVSMDSSNMHFASCFNVPVVSIWGATHPSLGFYGWRQNPAWAVQRPLDCRPCSVYGKKPCRYGDYRCLKTIMPEEVLAKINEVVPLKNVQSAIDVDSRCGTEETTVAHRKSTS